VTLFALFDQNCAQNEDVGLERISIIYDGLGGRLLGRRSLPGKSLPGNR